MARPQAYAAGAARSMRQPTATGRAVALPTSVFEGMSREARTVRLRLRFTAQNYVWETDLARPAAARPPGLELAVGPDDVVHVQRRGGPPEQ